MKHNPVVEERKLIQVVQAGYGIKIANLEFLLHGWGGDCFRVEASGDKRHFLKLHDDANYMGIAVTSRPFYLPLMHQLHSKNILPHIPHPIPTRAGDFSLAIDSHEIVITNWIEGEQVGVDELPEPILRQLAKLVGILHNSRSQLEFEHPFVDAFEFGFESDLVDAIAGLETVSSSHSLGVQLLKKTILPHRDEMLTQFQRLRELQRKVRSLDKPKVVCHTDLHGNNLMTDAQGNLYILDWENALIAPPEHEMIFFAGEKNFWEVFWPEYTLHFDRPSLQSDLLSFYYLRRALEDIAGLVFCILQGEGGEARDRQDCKWLRDNLSGLAEVDKTVAEIQIRAYRNHMWKYHL